jgi:hypothetical protein
MRAGRRRALRRNSDGIDLALQRRQHLRTILDLHFAFQQQETRGILRQDWTGGRRLGLRTR